MAGKISRPFTRPWCPQKESGFVFPARFQNRTQALPDQLAERQALFPGFVLRSTMEVLG